MTFETAFSATMKREGGYVLHEVAGDRGGQTYAGIARRMNPQWAGWAWVDRKEVPPTELVRQFFRDGYWVPIKGDLLREDIAHSIYDFATNTSAPGAPVVAVKLAQIVAGTEPDGWVGPKTIDALNNMDPKHFAAAYALAKLKRYVDICKRDRTQAKFLLGWVDQRVLGAM